MVCCIFLITCSCSRRPTNIGQYKELQTLDQYMPSPTDVTQQIHTGRHECVHIGPNKVDQTRRDNKSANRAQQRILDVYSRDLHYTTINLSLG